MRLMIRSADAAWASLWTSTRSPSIERTSREMASRAARLPAARWRASACAWRGSCARAVRAPGPEAAGSGSDVTWLTRMGRSSSTGRRASRAFRADSGDRSPSKNRRCVRDGRAVDAGRRTRVKPIVVLWASPRVAIRRRGSVASGRADFFDGLLAGVEGRPRGRAAGRLRGAERRADPDVDPGVREQAPGHRSVAAEAGEVEPGIALAGERAQGTRARRGAAPHERRVRRRRLDLDARDPLPARLERDGVV